MDLLESRYVEALRGGEHTWYYDRWKKRLIAKFHRNRSVMYEGGSFAGDDREYIYDGTPVDIETLESFVLSIAHGRLNIWQVAPIEVVGSISPVAKCSTPTPRLKNMNQDLSAFLRMVQVPFSSEKAKMGRSKTLISYKEIRDPVTSEFMDMVRNFASGRVEVKECQQFQVYSEYQNTTEDEDLITMLFLLTSPVFRAFYSQDVRVSPFATPQSYLKSDSHSVETKLTYKDLRSFVHHIVGFDCPRLLRQVAKYMAYRRPMSVTTIMPDVLAVDIVMKSIAADYYLEDIEVEETEEGKVVRVHARPYTVQALAPLFMLNSIWSITQNVDFVCDTFERVLNDQKLMQFWSIRGRSDTYNMYTFNGHRLSLLQSLDPKKQMKLIGEIMFHSDSFGQLRDALNQWSEFANPESIPDIIKDAFPDGLKPPKKFKTVKEFHDKITRDYAAIKRASHKNKPILYTEEILKIDGMEILDTKLVLPKITGELIEWGTLLNNCIGSYGDRASRGEMLLFALYKGDEVKMTGEVNHGKLNQLVENRNAQAHSKYHAEVKKFITEEFLKAVEGLEKLYPEREPDEMKNRVLYAYDAYIRYE